MSERILFVDDEPRVLSSLQRQLRRKFDLETAAGGPEGLDAIRTAGPFAVVVSDMRMPGMDGVEFLVEVQRVAPETVRMMLTGNADQESAIRSINEGRIFRFLSKPCDPPLLERALRDALDQHRLIVSERSILEQTVAGSIGLLTDLLSLSSTNAPSADRMSELAGAVAEELGADPWEVEMGAMLRSIGRLTIPPDLLARAEAGEDLDPRERTLLGRAPEAGYELLRRIPRLERVAEIVRTHRTPFFEAKDAPDGARILNALVDFFEATEAGAGDEVAFSTLRSRRETYDPRVLDALEHVVGLMEADGGPKRELLTVPLKEILVGHILVSDVERPDGRLLVSKGSVVTRPLLERIRNYARVVGIVEPITVEVPASRKRRRRGKLAG